MISTDRQIENVVTEGSLPPLATEIAKRMSKEHKMVKCKILDNDNYLFSCKTARVLLLLVYQTDSLAPAVHVHTSHGPHHAGNNYFLNYQSQNIHSNPPLIVSEAPRDSPSHITTRELTARSPVCKIVTGEC